MSVRIQLDNPHTFYTNLDHISGRIILSLSADESISAILVKLEGESRTVLMRPPPSHQNQQMYGRQAQRQGVAMENHKILYKVASVFPSADLQSPGAMLGGSYTLRAGTHEYPFRFKMPINNGCSDPQSQQMGPGSGFGGFGLGGLQQLQYRHVKRTLPPSLTGFPGEAEIRYYIKVTVQRPSIFKENRRSAIGFKFLPIEPPRAPKTTNEVFARRPFIFQKIDGAAKGKGGLFKKKPPELSDTPPKGEVDARLPSPAILTCNEPLPLRLIVRKTSESAEDVYLQSLQVHLIGSTEVRAQDVVRTEVSTWVLMSLTGLSIKVLGGDDQVRAEKLVDDGPWRSIPLPNTVAPSFATCNLKRWYEVEVRVGLGYGVKGDIQPQTILLPLRFEVEIYSGISPPAALLSAMASRPHAATPANPPTNPPNFPPRPPNEANALYPPQLTNNANIPEVDDAPPSYEDAIADEIVVADGPRREYSGVTDVNAPGLDEKGAAPSYSRGGGTGPGGGSSAT